MQAKNLKDRLSDGARRVLAADWRWQMRRAWYLSFTALPERVLYVCRAAQHWFKQNFSGFEGPNTITQPPPRPPRIRLSPLTKARLGVAGTAMVFSGTLVSAAATCGDPENENMAEVVPDPETVPLKSVDDEEVHFSIFHVPDEVNRPTPARRQQSQKPSAAGWRQMRDTATRVFAPAVAEEAPVENMPDFFTKKTVREMANANPRLALRFINMCADMPPHLQGHVQVASGYRSYARQGQLFAQAVRKYGSPAAARKWVAPPGKSMHNHGLAFDLHYKSAAARHWVHRNAHRYKLHFRMSHENWHIEPVEAARSLPKLSIPAAGD